MDQPSPQLNIQFGLFHKILSCFDRRELCHLRNVNHRHYTVIENKFGTSPYLMFSYQALDQSSWRWRPLTGNQIEEMPIHVCEQLPTSKFVRFNHSFFMISSVNVLIVPLISHVWENQQIFIECAPTYMWNEKWACMMAKAKHLDVTAKGLIPYLPQLTSGNCVHLHVFALNETLDDYRLPWGHILDFLFKPNTEGITISDPSNYLRGQMLEFRELVTQKFLDSLVQVDFSFVCNSITSNDEFTFDDFIVHNRRTKQCLRFHSTAYNFKLTVEQCEQ
ncbi:hypothetical protein DdX_21227 [Ditylenchus destructor]|uniref:F-box domain-containing protein n=1 Tax=Ditylenchus destructor TaxID=166010 RepID=A0AAD4MF72_9BILA|nr:hypothetical protein DdX_21227 [Ditylenchus destructor]